MFIYLLILAIILYYLLCTREYMTCKDVQIDNPPIASPYDITMVNNVPINNIFLSEKNAYVLKLKKYINDLQLYCRI